MKRDGNGGKILSATAPIMGSVVELPGQETHRYSTVPEFNLQRIGSFSGHVGIMRTRMKSERWVQDKFERASADLAALCEVLCASSFPLRVYHVYTLSIFTWYGSSILTRACTTSYLVSVFRRVVATWNALRKTPAFDVPILKLRHFVGPPRTPANVHRLRSMERR